MTPTRLAVLFALSLSPALVFAQDKPNDSTIGAKPPADAVVLFNGKSLENWTKLDGKTPATWPVENGVFTIGKGQGSIRTAKSFGSFKLHLEFNVPLMPEAKGQARGNSGVYLDGDYELQLLDSFGLKSQNNDCAAIYQQIAPRVNACKPPLEWQTYDVTFHKAETQGDKVVKKARLTVIHNGVNVIDNAEIGLTPGGVGGKEGAGGPLMLQDHGNTVKFRNIWLVPIGA